MAPQEAKNRPKKGRRGCKNDPKPQVEPRSAPSRHQDRPGTIPGVAPPTFPSLLGVHLGAPKRPKRSRKRSKIKAKIESRKKAIQDDQEPILERSWSLWGRHVGARRPQKYWKTYYFAQNHFFEDKSVRRRFWDQLRPTKAPRGAKMTPKRDPRSTRNDPKST